MAGDSIDFKSLLKDIGRKIYDELHDAIEDITTLQVITIVGKEYAVKPAKEEVDITGKKFVARRKTEIADEEVIAKTIIEIDGDIILKLPVKEGNGVSINKEIMELHERNVRIAVENWREFLKGLIDVCEGLMKYIK